jgi:hypothetical protein
MCKYPPPHLIGILLHMCKYPPPHLIGIVLNMCKYPPPHLIGILLHMCKYPPPHLTGILLHMCKYPPPHLTGILLHMCKYPPPHLTGILGIPLGTSCRILSRLDWFSLVSLVKWHLPPLGTSEESQTPNEVRRRILTHMQTLRHPASL